MLGYPNILVWAPTKEYEQYCVFNLGQSKVCLWEKEGFNILDLALNQDLTWDQW
jgi:hypothetical protein